VVAALLLFAGGVGAYFLFRDRGKPAPAEAKGNGADTKADGERRDPKVEEALQKLEAERKKLAEEREKLGADRRKADAAHLVEDGNKALAAKNYSEAIAAFTKALDLDKDNAAAQRGLTLATQLAQKEQEDRAKSAEEEKKRRADYDRLLTDGRSAMAAKKYADAVTAFTAAVDKVPSEEARKLLADASAALAAEKAGKEAADKYAAHMAAGNAAMIGMRYADALREFLAAQRLMPDDPAAKKAREQAEARLEGEQDREKRKAAFATLLDRGRAALAALRYDEAVASLESADKLVPGDPTVQQLLAQARQALGMAKNDYTRYMQAADAALALGRYEEAFRNYTEALRAMPGDAAATRGLQKLQRLSEDVQAAQAAYLRYMTLAANLMQQGRYLDAQVQYNEALRVMPADAEALAGVRAAQVAIDREVARVAEREQRRKSIDTSLGLADSAVKAHRWADAMRSVNDVLKLDSDNRRALALQSQARFGQAMDDGQKAQQARRWADAERAYQQALAERPNDPVATANLKLARQMQGK
jgi:stress-induced-phosphoprotein 1